MDDAPSAGEHDEVRREREELRARLQDGFGALVFPARPWWDGL